MCMLLTSTYARSKNSFFLGLPKETNASWRHFKNTKFGSTVEVTVPVIKICLRTKEEYSLIPILY